MTSYIGLYL